MYSSAQPWHQQLHVFCNDSGTTAVPPQAPSSSGRGGSRCGGVPTRRSPTRLCLPPSTSGGTDEVLYPLANTSHYLTIKCIVLMVSKTSRLMECNQNNYQHSIVQCFCLTHDILGLSLQSHLCKTKLMENKLRKQRAAMDKVSTKMQRQ